VERAYQPPSDAEVKVSSAIGIDIQYSRSSVVLRETSGRGDRIAVVGDGRRRLIPNAVGGGQWGSTAAEAVLTAGSGPLLRWLGDPWDEPFLRGLKGRLTGYLGAEPGPGHHMTLVVPPEIPEARVADQCAAAGLRGIGRIDPADGLLCRWLAEPMADARSGPVAVIVLGEAYTAVAVYQVDRAASRPQIHRLTGALQPLPHGSGAWCLELARLVLDRVTEGTAPVDPLDVLDGVVEFGVTLAEGDSMRSTEWTGPLADRMFAPLRLTRAELLKWPGVRAVTDALPDLARTALDAAKVTPAHVITGGVGAVWPFYGEALQGLGKVWRSDTPEHDLAIGAVWWPELAAHFGYGRLPAATLEPVPEPVTASSEAAPALLSASPARSAPSEPPVSPESNRDETPPWLRK
jgi:hypothetical protein